MEGSSWINDMVIDHSYDIFTNKREINRDVYKIKIWTKFCVAVNKIRDWCIVYYLKTNNNDLIMCYIYRDSVPLYQPEIVYIFAANI